LHNRQPVLKVEHLTYRYASGQAALSDVSFEIGIHETVGLVGPNGAGKTTLLLHLNGLLPGGAANGNGFVEVLGLRASGTNLTEIRRLVGLLFQDPDDQLFCRTVLEDVAFGPLNLGFPEAEVRRRVTAALDAVGLPDVAARGTHELSFGERRRVCLAGVLACEPELLALDEPSSNLDPRARRGFMDVLRQAPAAKLIASHDLELILELCERVIVLDHGRIQAQGPPRDLFADARLMDAHGLEVPLSLRKA